jgi:hypothetical protein
MQVEDNKMKITKRQLRRIIKEEKTKLLNEQASDAMRDLETTINDFIIDVDRFFAKNSAELEPTGVLDDPDSWAIRLEEMRYDLGQLAQEMMAGNRRIR